MDLYAYTLKSEELIEKYISKHYGEIPRYRGVRFMKVEQKSKKTGEQFDIFNKYVGTDTIYIHTRCGGCGLKYADEYCNYRYFKADEWEQKHKDLFLENISDEFDCTYADHYFKAVIDDDYKEIIKWFEKEKADE